MRFRSMPIGTYLFAVLLVVAVVVASLGAFFAVDDFNAARRQAGLDSAFQARLAAEATADAISQSLDSIQATANQPAAVQLITQLQAHPDQCPSAIASGGWG